jgi:serine phosphatase RsbU (regulator of sigma subunit)
MANNKRDIDNELALRFFEQELENFKTIAKHIKPLSGEIPEINSIDIYGESIPFNGVAGGDHIIYIDFKKRCDLDKRIGEAKKSNRMDLVEKLELNKRRAGILIADAAGHNITDALLVAMLHQAFLTGAQYEMREKGEITTELFEILNNRFLHSSSLAKFITLLYGEIYEDGKFRFINAGHPDPVVFSNKFNKLFKISFRHMIHFPPIGTLPSKDDVDSGRKHSRLGYKKKYAANEIKLMGNGDILLLYTDGFSEHNQDLENFYFPYKLEETLTKIKAKPAKEIYFLLKEDFLNFAPTADDITFVVIKKL